MRAGRPRPAPGGRLLPALLLLLAALAAGCGNPFFRPVRGLELPPGAERIARKDVFFPSGDGLRLHGWLLPPRGGAPSKGTVLFLHGNDGNVATHLGPAARLAEAGFAVFAFDYRGYGRSEGKPTFEGIHEDARAALALLPSLPGVEPGRIAVVGQSLGGSVAIYTVAHASGPPPVKAVAVDAAFSGYRRIVRDRMSGYPLAWLTKYPASLLFPDDWRADRAVASVSPVPLVVIHGTADRVVPFSHGERLYRLAREPKEFWPVEGAGHGEALADPATGRRLAEFLEEALGKAERP